MIVERVNLIKDDYALDQIQRTGDYGRRVELCDHAFVELEESAAAQVLERLGCEDVTYRGEKKAGVPSAVGPPDFTARLGTDVVGAEVTEFFRRAVHVKTRHRVKQRSFDRVQEELQSGDLEVLKRHIPNAERAMRGVSYYVVTDALDCDTTADAWDFIMKTIGGSSVGQRSESMSMEVVFNNHRQCDADTVVAELFLAWAGAGYDKTRLRAELVKLPDDERRSWMDSFRRRLGETVSTSRTDASGHEVEGVGIFRVALTDTDEIGVVTIMPTMGGEIMWSDILDSSELRKVAQRKEGDMRKAESSGTAHDQRWLLLVDRDRESLLAPPREVRKERERENVSWTVERDKSDFPEWCRYWHRIVFFDSVEVVRVNAEVREGEAR